MARLPEKMRSLVATKYCWPTEWEVADMPVPKIEDPNDILIKVHAAGITTGDTLLVRGPTRFIIGKLKYIPPQVTNQQRTYLYGMSNGGTNGKARFPHKLGIECSGTVVEVGSAVADFKPGDEVSAFAHSHTRPMNLLMDCGFASEYAVSRAHMTLHKPRHVAFAAMCSMANLVTAVQTIEMGLRLLRENGVADGLEGKTVFVPGALSATGAVGIQVLKNVYGVGRLISTVSTAKVPLVERYLPGLVDQVVDYTKHKKLTDAIPAGSVDFVYNTQWGVETTFPLVNPETGVVASISSVPTPQLFREMLPPLPFFAYWACALAQWYYWFKLRGTNIKHEVHSGNMAVREDYERAGELIATGKVKPVNRVVELEDIEAVRREAQKVATGKGGIGKLVIKIA
ncbi:GroES-like protein [Hypoxylon sp. FL0543]|nr:GroES-like protein [Hypoxylon sp. FL0543]